MLFETEVMAAKDVDIKGDVGHVMRHMIVGRLNGGIMYRSPRKMRRIDSGDRHL